MHYRVCLLNQVAQTRATQSFSALNDKEAAAIAADLYGTLSDVFDGYELRQGDWSMNATRRQSAPPPDPTKWAEARQQKMLDLEDYLARSFECVRTSRQLLASVDKLLDRQDRPAGLASLTASPRDEMPA